MQPGELPSENDSGSIHKPAGSSSSWGWPVAWMVTVLVLVSGSLYVFKSCRDLPVEAISNTGKVVEQVGLKAQQVAAAFKQGTITTTFTSYATAMSGSQYLQF